MAQAGVWSADKRLKNPDFSGCGAPWRESRRFRILSLGPSKIPWEWLKCSLPGDSFFLFRLFGVYLVFIQNVIKYRT